MKSLVNEFWKIPFLRFLIPFVLGIIIGDICEIQSSILLFLSVLFFCLSIAYIPFLNHNNTYGRRWVFGSLISIGLFFISYYSMVVYNHLDNKIASADFILAMVDEPPKETEKSIKITCKVQEFSENDIWIKDKSKLLVYLEKDSRSKSLKYGDIVFLQSNLRAVENAGNPYEFDYKKYLKRKLIYFQSYNTSEQWMKIESKKGNHLYIFAYNIRDEVLNIYRKAGILGNEYAILSALTLGVKDYLSDDIVRNYSRSGAMHVLAVSGLHVGILTIMLNFLFGSFRKIPQLKLIYTLVVLSILWLFAIITGLTPSVTRSALMFSFFIIGENLGKKASSLNSLAASAFVILSFNPNALFSAGFQLSFLAVASILLFQSRIERMLNIKNIFLRHIWQLTSVSIAAQIGTTPISVYYFHQIPIYALITNIFVVPAAMLIMYLTAMLIAFSFIQLITNVLGMALSFVLKLLNASTQFIENLPVSSIEFISLSNIELVIIYSVMLLIIFTYITKEKKLIFVILILLISMFGVRDYNRYNNLSTSNLVVFNTRKNFAIAKICNSSMILYADSSIAFNEKNTNYLCSNIRASRLISDFLIQLITEKDENTMPIQFINVENLKIAYLSGNTDRFETNTRLPLDYVVIGAKSSMSIENIARLFDVSKFVIDSSMPKWKQKIIERDCKRNNIECFNVNTDGAFVLRI